MKAAERVAEAERQKFEEARKTVDRFFVSVSEDTLLSQPGMQDLRKTLLRDAGIFFKLTWRIWPRRLATNQMKIYLPT